MKSFFLGLLFSGSCFLAKAQPYALAPDISIELYASVNGASSCIAYDSITQRIFYGNVDGDVRSLFEDLGHIDSVMFTADDHEITYLQGMTFADSSMYLIGNDWTDGTQGIGMVKRGKLNPDGSRTWSTVFKTALYPATNASFDHGFSGIAIDPDGTFIYASSGSRSDHGEIQDAEGLYPGVREVPLTSAIFKIPIDAEDLLLPNDLAALEQGGWLFSDGTRNTFSMAFNAAGHLFGVENSGDRDDPEEINWLQEGQHYGYPWIMGNNETPQQFSGYDPDEDPLVNPNCKAYQLGYFYDDPTFEARPEGVTFTPPLDNYGPDANFYRDETDGKIYQAIGGAMGSFTTHRSPLGLTFDSKELLAPPYRGGGFMLSFTQGNGDSTGYHPNSVWGLPVVPIDTSEDLMHLDVVYDEDQDQYSLSAKRIAAGFSLPVDAILVDSTLYALEYGYSGERSIWKISLPGGPDTGIPSLSSRPSNLKLFPNPAISTVEVSFNFNPGSSYEIRIIDQVGRLCYMHPQATSGRIELNTRFLSKGIYSVQLIENNLPVAVQKLIRN